jgi:hypothetical protein
VVVNGGMDQGYALPASMTIHSRLLTFVQEGMELDLHQRIAHRARVIGPMTSWAVRFEESQRQVTGAEQRRSVRPAAVHAAF